MKTLLAVAVLAAAAPAFASSDASFAASLQAARLQIKAANVPLTVLASRDEEEAFLKLLEDKNPSVRISALQGLKNYVNGNYRTREKVLDVLASSRETAEVRYQAVKTLSWAAGNREVYEKLFATAERTSETAAMRSIAYKALAWQLGGQSNIRSEVLDAAKRERDQTVRLGAIWALYTVIGQWEVRDGLKDIAKRTSETETVRVAALKSLYGMMGDNDVRDLAIDYAKNKHMAENNVRYAAIMMLSTRFNNRERELLEEIASSDPDDRAKIYASKALAQNRAVIAEFFHLPLRDTYGRPITDPLDNE
jgi:hypothetical protein